MRRAFLCLPCLIALSFGCASKHEGAATTPEPPDSTVSFPESPPTSSTDKTRAPIDVTLESSPIDKGLELRLRFRATADIPDAHARFVLPPGVSLVDGALEHDLGPLARDEARTLTVRVAVSAAATGLIAAGVDCQMSRGVKLHAGAVLMLGAKSPTSGRVIPGIRIHDAKPAQAH